MQGLTASHRNPTVDVRPVDREAGRWSAIFAGASGGVGFGGGMGCGRGEWLRLLLFWVRIWNFERFNKVVYNPR